MRYLIVFLIILQSLLASSQSLDYNRIKRIKDATVRITIDGVDIMGSGFVVNDKGFIGTCWHVIYPALYLTEGKYKSKQIYAEYNDGTKIKVSIATYCLTSGNIDAVAYDYCWLIPDSTFKSDVIPLKIGKFEKAIEGDEIYTCGYPLGIPTQVINKGIISTKFIQPNSVTTSNNEILTKPRKAAYLDMTLNKGNSGGAVIKIGRTIDEDEVIGMADFIINPIMNKADSLISTLKNSEGYVKLQGIDSNKTMRELVEFLSSSSVGIGGIVSIDYFRIALTAR